MTKTNKKQKNHNPVELKEHLSHRIGNVGEVQVNKAYAVGDTMRYAGKAVKVVEVLEDKIQDGTNGVVALHVKNQQAPFDSFLIEHGALNTTLDKAVENFGTEALAKAIVQDVVVSDAPSVELEVINDYNVTDSMVREDKSINL